MQASGASSEWPAEMRALASQLARTMAKLALNGASDEASLAQAADAFGEPVPTAALAAVGTIVCVATLFAILDVAYPFIRRMGVRGGGPTLAKMTWAAATLLTGACQLARLSVLGDLGALAFASSGFAVLSDLSLFFLAAGSVITCFSAGHCADTAASSSELDPRHFRTTRVMILSFGLAGSAACQIWSIVSTVVLVSPLGDTLRTKADGKLLAALQTAMNSVTLSGLIKILTLSIAALTIVLMELLVQRSLRDAITDVEAYKKCCASLAVSEVTQPAPLPLPGAFPGSVYPPKQPGVSGTAAWPASPRADIIFVPPKRASGIAGQSFRGVFDPDTDGTVSKAVDHTNVDNKDDLTSSPSASPPIRIVHPVSQPPSFGSFRLASVSISEPSVPSPALTRKPSSRGGPRRAPSLASSSSATLCERPSSWQSSALGLYIPKKKPHDVESLTSLPRRASRRVVSLPVSRSSSTASSVVLLPRSHVPAPVPVQTHAKPSAQSLHETRRHRLFWVQVVGLVMVVWAVLLVIETVSVQDAAVSTEIAAALCFTEAILSSLTAAIALAITSHQAYFAFSKGQQSCKRRKAALIDMA